MRMQVEMGRQSKWRGNGNESGEEMTINVEMELE
jgi:hypothetical protein